MDSDDEAKGSSGGGPAVPPATSTNANNSYLHPSLRRGPTSRGKGLNSPRWRNNAPGRGTGRGGGQDGHGSTTGRGHMPQDRGDWLQPPRRHQFRPLGTGAEKTEGNPPDSVEEIPPRLNTPQNTDVHASLNDFVEETDDDEDGERVSQHIFHSPTESMKMVFKTMVDQFQQGKVHKDIFHGLTTNERITITASFAGILAARSGYGGTGEADLVEEARHLATHWLKLNYTTLINWINDKELLLEERQSILYTPH